MADESDGRGAGRASVGGGAGHAPPEGVIPAVLDRAIRGYQRWLSPLLGRNCRFDPTCSEYMRQSLRKHGVIRGGLRGLGRICRCHPWGGGGWDPP